MAKRIAKIKTPTLYCRDCIYLYDLHEIGANGKPFMGRCMFSIYKKLINYHNCDKLKTAKH